MGWTSNFLEITETSGGVHLIQGISVITFHKYADSMKGFGKICFIILKILWV